MQLWNFGTMELCNLSAMGWVDLIFSDVDLADTGAGIYLKKTESEIRDFECAWKSLQRLL